MEDVRFQKISQDVVKVKFYRKQEMNLFRPCNQVAFNFNMESGWPINIISAMQQDGREIGQTAKKREKWK